MDWALLLSPFALPEVLAAIGMLLLAAWLLYLNLDARTHRALAFLLATRAGGMLGGTLQDLSTDALDIAYWARVSPYFALAHVGAMLAFAAAYPRPRRWFAAGRLGRLAPFLALAGLEALYLMDHALCCSIAVDTSGAPIGAAGAGVSLVATGPLLLLVAPPALGYAALGLLFAFDTARASPGPSRDSMGIVSLAFTLTAAYDAVYTLYIVRSAGEAGAWFELLGASAYMALGLVALTALSLTWRAARTPDPHATRQAQRCLVLLPLPLLSALALGPANEVSEFVTTGVWRLALPILVTYAIVRHQLFDIDLKVKRTVKHGTVAVVFIVLYVVVSFGAQALVGGRVGPYLGIAAAGLLLFAILPLQRLADRVANATMPGVGDAVEYLNLKRLEVYRGTLERAIAQEGVLTAREAEMLAALRTDLGITDRDHAVLEHALRASGTSGMAVAMAPGQLFLGRYRVHRKLGEGGSGASYLCKDERVGREVVLKRLRSIVPTVEGLEAVQREARAIGALRHPNVVTLHDVEQLGGEAVIVMEYLDGGSLRQRLARGPLTAHDFARVCDDTLAALEAVHAAGMVHRDVKPSNIFLTGDGRAKLADFGIAHIPGFETTAGAVGGAGAAVGTVRYMSPEQARGHSATPRSDLFSAAATLYEAYTGRPYLDAKEGESAFDLQVRAAAAGPFDRALPADPSLRRCFARALHPDPGGRFASAAQMRGAFARATGLIRAGSRAASDPRR